MVLFFVGMVQKGTRGLALVLLGSEVESDVRNGGPWRH